MLQFYHCFITYCYGDKIIWEGTSNYVINESEQIILEDEQIKITWGNLEEFFARYHVECPFDYVKTKKGLKVHLLNKIRPIKEWKQKNFEIIVTRSYRKFTPTLDRVLRWHDCDKALQYLAEKGIDIHK